MFVFYLYIKNTSSKGGQKAITAYWIVVGLIGFFFVPPSGFDLPRLIGRMHRYGILPFDVILDSLTTTLTPGERLYYWLLYRLPMADRLLPCISGLISFGFCFSLLKDHILKEKNTPKEIAIALFLFMARGSIMVAIDTIRAYMASAIIAWCVYQEMVNKKSFVKHILLYIFACSMHAMGYALLLLRVIHTVIYCGKITFKSIIYRVIVIVGVVLSAIYLKNIWSMLFDKANKYYESGVAGTGYAYVWEGVLAWMTIILAIFLIYSIFSLRRNRIGNDLSGEEIREPSMNQFCHFVVFVILVDVVTSFIEYNFFMRTAYFITILLIPVSLYAIRLARKSGCLPYLSNCLHIAATAIFLLTAARGYLCSLKFFEL